MHSGGNAGRQSSLALTKTIFDVEDGDVRELAPAEDQLSCLCRCLDSLLFWVWLTLHFFCDGCLVEQAYGGHENFAFSDKFVRLEELGSGSFSIVDKVTCHCVWARALPSFRPQCAFPLTCVHVVQAREILTGGVFAVKRSLRVLQSKKERYVVGRAMSVAYAVVPETFSTLVRGAETSTWPSFKLRSRLVRMPTSYGTFGRGKKKVLLSALFVRWLTATFF